MLNLKKKSQLNLEVQDYVVRAIVKRAHPYRTGERLNYR